MVFTLLVMLRISLPISNIELKHQERYAEYRYCISLPISNIELKRRVGSLVISCGISLPISNIELKHNSHRSYGA